MAARPNFTPEQKRFLATVAADVIARPDFYREGGEYLEREFSAKALKRSRPTAPKRGWFHRIDVRLRNAFSSLLNQGIETPPGDYLRPSDCARVKAVLVLTWLLTDPGADSHALGKPFGPWGIDVDQGGGQRETKRSGRQLVRSRGRAKAAWVTLDSLDGSPKRIEGQEQPRKRRTVGRVWFKLVKRAWKALGDARDDLAESYPRHTQPGTPLIDEPQALRSDHPPETAPTDRIGPETHVPTHSADFTFVNWFGTEFHFALGVQSSAVKALWIEWETTGLGLHQDTIRNAVDRERDSFRMDKAFRNHAAFGTMIRSSGDGRYKLAPPDAGKAADTDAKKSLKIPTKSRRTPR